MIALALDRMALPWLPVIGTLPTSAIPGVGGLTPKTVP